MQTKNGLHDQSASPGKNTGIGRLAKPIPFSWLLCGGYMALIFYLSGLSEIPIPVLFHSQDFFLHIIEYAVLGYLLSLALVSTPVSRYVRLYTFLIILAHGVGDELHQTLVPLRDPSLMDVVADTLGGLLGILIFHSSAQPKHPTGLMPKSWPSSSARVSR